jgi:hypothetical protein
MPRRIADSPTCTICQHEKRHEIEMLRAAGCSLDSIAGKCGAHRDAIWRHWTKHVTNDVKSQYLADIPIAEIAERAAKEGGSLLSYLSLVRSAVFQQLLLAGSVNDSNRVATLAGRATEVLREIGRVTGELSSIGSLTVHNSATVFVNSPAYAKLETMLLDKLRDHPAALREVVAGLRELELEGEDDQPDGEGRPMITLPAARGFDAATA